MSAREIQHSIEYGAVRGAIGAAGVLPLAAVQRIGVGAGALAFDVFRVRRDVSVDNIERSLCVPHAEAVRIGRRSYRNLGRAMLEFCASARLTREEVLDLVALEGAEHLEEVRRYGRGAVLVAGHMGNWELFGASIVAHGFPLDFLVGQQSNGRVDEVMNGLRTRLGIGIITRAMALRKVLQALSDNRIIAMLADQDARSQGIMVDFFGRPASTARGPAMFALKKRSPILMASVHRDGKRHVGVIEPPLYPPDQTGEEAVRYLTQACADSLARAIRVHPDDYFWPHRRWKTKSV